MSQKLQSYQHRQRCKVCSSVSANTGMCQVVVQAHHAEVAALDVGYLHFLEGGWQGELVSVICFDHASSEGLQQCVTLWNEVQYFDDHQHTLTQQLVGDS